MHIQQIDRDGVTIVAPAGRIDTTTSGALDAGARSLLLDLGDVDYISSAGLRVLLVLARRMRDLQGRLVLCGLTGPVRQVFQLAGFLPLFRVEPSQDAALSTFTHA